ncbi:MAG TPA: PorV/PorQ family protein [Candidatus Glassbacteria bacterium]|nr:PorV/PorQ family protein [Candidatus Glassbacteria bacterium]
MLKKSAFRAIMTACVLLSFVTVGLYAQGVPRQDYTGLDKYLEQGRNADASFVGVRAAEFLTIPVGARAIAMGSAFSSVADDISSIWWNPAGLGFLQQRELMLTVVDYTLDLTYSYGGFAFPIGDGNAVVGGFFGYLDIPDMEITTIGSPDGTGSYFNAYDFQMGGSFAYNLSDRFTAGMNAKYVHEDVYNNVGGSAFAIDAGAIYHTELADREIKFAFAIQNLGTNITMRGPNLLKEVGPESRGGSFPSGYNDFSWDEFAVSRRGNRQAYIRTHTYRLPTTVKVALAYSLLTSESVNWIASAELWRNNNIPISYATGSELTYNFNPVISASLRGGWQIQTDEYTEGADQFGYTYLGDDPTFRGLSVGGGIKRVFGGRHVEFSYAYRNRGRLTADNFFTLTFGF